MAESDANRIAVGVVYLFALLLIPLCFWWVWRQMIVRPFLQNDVQVNLLDWICCTCPPSKDTISNCPPCTTQPPDDSSELKSAWIKKWKFHGIGWLFFLIWFICLSISRSQNYGDGPTFASYFANHLLGIGIITPWVLGLTDFVFGSCFLYCYMMNFPLPNTRKRYELERWSFSMFSLFIFTMIGFSTGYTWGSDTPRLVTKEIPLSRLPSCLDGLKVFQITDVLVGPLVTKEFISSFAKEVNSIKPDIVVHTGDGGEGTVATVGDLTLPLTSIITTEKYFVTGNHEYYHGNRDSKEWEEHYTNTLNFHTLHNNKVEYGNSQFPTRGCGVNDKLYLVGIPDTGEGNPDLKTATSGINENEEWLLLSHQPNAFTEASQLHVGLQLSGHVHAGQSWPLHPITYLANQQRFSGLRKEQNSLIYVSNGQANWGPRLRLFSRPENTLLILRNEAIFTNEGKTIDLSNTSETNMAIAGLIIVPIWLLCHLIVYIIQTYYINHAWWIVKIQREAVKTEEDIVMSRDGDVEMQVLARNDNIDNNDNNGLLIGTKED